MDGAVGCGLQGMGGAVWPVLHGLQRKIRGERESLVEGLSPSALPEFGISFGLLACSNGGCHHVSNYMSFGANTCSLLQLQPGRAGGIGRQLPSFRTSHIYKCTACICTARVFERGLGPEQEKKY